MVTIKLIGGLGNQMFVYAFGKSISTKLNLEMIIDVGWIKRMEEKNQIDLYGLKYFNLNRTVKFRSEVDVFSKYDSKIWSYILRVTNSITPYKWKSVLIEKSYSYDEKISQINRKNLYVKQGYWQSYKYFESIEKELRLDFVFTDEVKKEAGDFAKLLEENPSSVSIHIRRGDYETNPRVKKVHGGICGVEYYSRAIEFILNRVKSPHFYVFSDDLKWAKEAFLKYNNLDITYVDNNSVVTNIGHDDKGYIDMYLMSLCKHNIIANSSFSWWGAWLNNNVEKIVIAPKKWFNDSRDTSDLILPTWFRV